MDNRLLHRFDLRHPIIQAPMAGGGDTPALVAAACNAGALGCIGAAYLTPDQIREASAAVRERTSRPFGINLFAPQAVPPLPPDFENALRPLQRYHAELGLASPQRPQLPVLGFEAQLNEVLASGASAFSFTFGLMPAEVIEAVRAKGMYVLGTATTPAEAAQLEASGVDAVVAQGSEAGGHRGTFATDFASGMIGTVALVPQVVDAVKVPVVASGGIADGRGIASALVLGASAVQIGTAFLACDEAGVPDAYKDAILRSRAEDTRWTRVFSGRPARGIVNRMIRDMEAASDPILPFPWQNVATRALRAAAARANRAEFLSLWAGQAAPLARRERASELIARLSRETAAALAGARERAPEASWQ